MAIRAENDEISEAVIFCFAPRNDVGLLQRYGFTIASAAIPALEQQIEFNVSRDFGPVTHTTSSVSISSSNASSAIDSAASAAGKSGSLAAAARTSSLPVTMSA